MTVAAAHACFVRGDFGGAETILNALIDRNPVDADALSLLAGVRHAQGDLNGALALFERAIEAQPYDVLIVFNHAVLLAELGRHADAIGAYDNAIRLRPDDAQAHLARAASLQLLGRNAEALEGLDKANRFGLADAVFHATRAAALSGLLRHEEALAASDRVLQIAPGNERSMLQRATSLLALERAAEALDTLNAVLARAPNNARALALRSSALANVGRFDEALADINLVLSRQPDRADYLNRLGYVLSAANRGDEAIAAYDRVLAQRPHDLDVRYAKADALLAGGDYARGLPLYESRPRTFTPTLAPLWLGDENIEGKSVLVQGEQGFGDLFEFCRFIPALKARGAKVFLQERAQTQRLLRSLDGGAEFVSRHEIPPATDFRVPIASLMLALEVRVASLPGPIPYLRAEPDAVARWRKTLGAGQRKRIGISWTAGGAAAIHRWRKMEAAPLARLLQADADFVSLQMDAGAENALLEQRDVRQFGDATQDFAELAALIEALDLVISVDTGVAHLAGALGKPVWVLLPHRADWRWLRERTDSPWYPSARLFRQPRFGDWDSVIDAVHAALQ